MFDIEAVRHQLGDQKSSDSPLPCPQALRGCEPSDNHLVTKSNISRQTQKEKVIGVDPSKLSFLARIDKTAERKRLRQQPEGKVLRNRFCLIKTLGSGGMGDVYLAKDLLREEMQDSSPFVALKLLNEQCQAQEGALQALQREAKKAQALSHPNIVTVFDFDRCGDTAFISMEYLEGQTLKEYLAEHGTMSYSKAMRIVERVARGLAYAHQEGFVHADIKPANIFLSQDGGVKILDFGIARVINAAQEPMTAGDKLTAFALTPNYATVASLQGETISARDDVFALACVAYQLLTGRHPYTTHYGLPVSALEAQEQGLKVESVFGLKLRHMRALRKALRFDAELSFANAGEFIDAIKARQYSNTIASLIAAGAVAIMCSVAAQSYWSTRVPSLAHLPVELATVAALVREGDRSLAAKDVDLAHRLYSQAWLDVQMSAAHKKTRNIKLVRAIIQERTNAVVAQLVQQASERGLSEFQVSEYLVALEVFLENEFVSSPYKIRKAISDLKARTHPPLNP
ncbi:serine/threonine-protein kinase [Marinagarivorans algicola]|uniref:serine/threonine-protein kinase n=1 Tax=Marinagarivorans algicola TaxID=1513270 RepID=UPI0006B64131|nr:serine/threonine-protein kinase [Marinagarivorans algicola]